MLKSAVQEQVQRVLKEMKVPVKDDIAELESRIVVLERRVAELEGIAELEGTLPETRMD